MPSEVRFRGILGQNTPIPLKCKNTKNAFSQNPFMGGFSSSGILFIYIHLPKNKKNYHRQFFVSWCMFSSHVWDQVAPGCSSTHPPGDLHLPGQGWADLQVVVVPLVGRGWRGEEERAGRRLQSFPPYRPPGGSGGWKMLKIKNKATCSPCSTIFLFLASLPSKISLASNPDPAPTPSGGSSRPWKSDVDANCCSSAFFQVVWFPCWSCNCCSPGFFLPRGLPGMIVVLHLRQEPTWKTELLRNITGFLHNMQLFRLFIKNLKSIMLFRGFSENASADNMCFADPRCCYVLLESIVILNLPFLANIL